MYIDQLNGGNVALSKHINEILDFSFHNFFSCFFIVLCTENIVFQVAIRYQPFGVKNNLDFIIEVNIFTYKKVSYYFNGHSDIERGKNLLLKLSKVDPIFLEILLFSKYLVKYTGQPVHHIHLHIHVDFIKHVINLAPPMYKQHG